VKKKVVCTFLCLLLSFTYACANNQQEDEAKMSAKMDKFIYAETMNFRYAYDHALIGGSRINAELMSKIEEVIFSITKDEAVKYGDDVLVAYPGERTESTLIQLNLHIAEYGKVVSDEVDPADFSLEYPITMSDLVEKWENVSQLLKSLSPDTLYYIGSH
jgi:predicted dinucleotide-binding enzyme